MFSEVDSAVLEDLRRTRLREAAIALILRLTTERLVREMRARSRQRDDHARSSVICNAFTSQGSSFFSGQLADADDTSAVVKRRVNETRANRLGRMSSSGSNEYAVELLSVSLQQSISDELIGTRNHFGCQRVYSAIRAETTW
jgi:hypothetical protein